MNTEKHNERKKIYPEYSVRPCMVGGVVEHIMVVGFHHKKGCVVEYCYPPIVHYEPNSDHEADNKHTDDDHHHQHPGNDPIRLPACWQMIASLSIPDGSHNYESDTVYFNIPDYRQASSVGGGGRRTLYCVSCYKQIQAKELLYKSDDITRSSVQKAVIVIMNYPVYGLIEYKLNIITKNYFQQKNFTKTQILMDSFQDLNRHISPDIVRSPDIFTGLSIKSLFTRFGTQIIILFKLFLLERKIIFIHSPIKELTNSILTVCSLFPGLIQDGLNDSIFVAESGETKNHHSHVQKKSPVAAAAAAAADDDDDDESFAQNFCDNISVKDEQYCKEEKKRKDNDKKAENDDDDDDDVDVEDDDEKEKELEEELRLYELWNAPLSHHGLPLKMFTDRSYLMPYFSISYFDQLIQNNARTFVGGSSNQIFRRWQNNIDVFVVDTVIEINCPNLRRAVRPTTEDMHFISYIGRAIFNDNDPNISDDDLFDDGGQQPKQQQRQQQQQQQFQRFADGSEQWIRLQFKSYLLHLLRCSLLDPETPEYRSFNVFFMDSLKQTPAYGQWTSGSGLVNVIKEIEPVHPFSSGRLNYLKLRLTNLILQRQEMLNQSINKVANVGGQALNQARTTVNSWLSNIGTSLQERAREATVAAASTSSTWKSYIPQSLSSRTIQILSSSESNNSSISNTSIPKPDSLSSCKDTKHHPEQCSTSRTANIEQTIAGPSSSSSPSTNDRQTPYTPEESETSV